MSAQKDSAKRSFLKIGGGFLVGAVAALLFGANAAEATPLLEQLLELGTAGVGVVMALIGLYKSKKAHE